MSSTNIDWNLIQSLDPVQIKRNKDSKSINAIIKSINSSFISSDPTVFANNPLTPKLMQLLQVTIQYLMSFQKHLSNIIEKRNKEYALLQKKLKKIEHANHQLTVINNNLRKPREVCPTCGKKFKIGYLDRHFQTRHPELIQPWNQIRSKSTIYHQKSDHAIKEEIAVIQKAKERKNNLEINKGNTIQISPNKNIKNEPNQDQTTQHQKDEQISLNQGQLDQMVDEISKRISERINTDKNSSTVDNLDFYKPSKVNQNSQMATKYNSVPSQKLQQFTLDARRHDQSHDHQHYIQQNEYSNGDFIPENKENANYSVSSLKKNSGNRVVFDPSVIENHCDSRRRNRNMNEVNDYDDYDYNDEYNNEENENYNYGNSTYNNKPRQNEKLNGQNNEISANELDDFIMGSSDVAISNHQAKPNQQQTQLVQSKPPQIQKQTPQSYNTKQQISSSKSKNTDNFHDELDDFMVESSEIAVSNHPNNSPPKIQQQQQQGKNNAQYQKHDYSNTQNHNDFNDEFDDFMIESANIKQQNHPKETTQPPKQQLYQKQQQPPPSYSQPKPQAKQIQSQQQPKQQKQQQQQQPKQQQLPKQHQVKQQQQQQKTMTKIQPAQNYNKQQPPLTSYNNSKDDSNINDDNYDAKGFNDEFDDFMVESSQMSKPKPTQKVEKSPPRSPPSPFPASPAPPYSASSASFPPSPASPGFQAESSAKKTALRSHNDNSAFEFTDASPRATSSSFRRSFGDEDEEFRTFNQLPKPPKRDLNNGSYVAITNDELDDLIKESSSIIEEEKSKKNPKKTTTGPKRNTKPINIKSGQIPSQFAQYSPSELEVILAEESSGMDNTAPKANYDAKSKYKNDLDDDYYYHNDDENNTNNNNNYYREDYYDDIPNETDYNDNYNNFNNYDGNGLDYNQNYKTSNYDYEDEYKNKMFEAPFQNQQSRQNLPEKIEKPPMSIAEARKMAKKKKKSQITTIGGVEFTDSQLAGFL